MSWCLYVLCVCFDLIEAVNYPGTDRKNSNIAQDEIRSLSFQTWGQSFDYGVTNIKYAAFQTNVWGNSSMNFKICKQPRLLILNFLKLLVCDKIIIIRIFNFPFGHVLLPCLMYEIRTIYNLERTTLQYFHFQILHAQNFKIFSAGSKK